VRTDGWLDGVRRVPSPNRDARPQGAAIELLVIHCISLPPGVFGGDSVERLFTNRIDPAAHPYFERLRAMTVSAHFLVDRAGALTQFVSCLERAWHAGASQWNGRDGCNDFSIGVEIEGSEFEPFMPAQYDALARLQRALCAAYPLRAARGHSEIAPGRKTDPGPLFDWQRIARDF
jgi:N-acetyl-anhydromuramoyl-L-alanine amidase